MFSDRVHRRLATIVDDADRLESFLTGLDGDAFAADDLMVLAVERLLQRITEAVIQIGPAEMERVAPGLPTGRIRAFGNRLRHDYDNIDHRLVYAIARESVPPLREAAARALAV
jgi:uncharacterized protein with HEPN domain